MADKVCFLTVLFGDERCVYVFHHKFILSVHVTDLTFVIATSVMCDAGGGWGTGGYCIVWQVGYWIIVCVGYG